MKTKLLIFLMDSYDLQYLQQKDKFPNLQRVGEPHPLAITFGLPGISAKGLYWFYTGKLWEKNIFLWKEFVQELSKKGVYFWNGLKTTMGILGFPITREAISENVKFAILLAKEQWTVYPIELHPKFNEEALACHRAMSAHALDDLKVSLDVITRVHNLTIKALKELKDSEVDCLMVYYNADWFSHRLRGAQLLEKVSWLDSLMGEVLDLVEADNIIVFSEHGAGHRTEAMYASTYPDKLVAFEEFLVFIKSKIWELGEK